MALPYSAVHRVFSAAAATATSTVRNNSAATIQLLIVNAGFSGTLDIQGSMTAGGTFVNLPYVVVGAGALTPAVAQLSYTTNTANHHIIVIAPMPFMRFVMTRSAGTITMDEREFSAPFSLAMVAA